MSTEAVVEFILGASPSACALRQAVEQLDAFREARDRGLESDVVRRLREATAGPQWNALVAGAAATAGGAPRDWVAVCAAAGSLVAEPAALADSVAIGGEVAQETAAALGPLPGWSIPAVAGSIGAGAAVGRLLGLDGSGLHQLLGLCATQAAGLAAAEPTDAGPLQLGNAAANAVEAGYLSRNGFTSAAHALEGRRGLFALLTGDPAAQLTLGAGWL